MHESIYFVLLFFFALAAFRVASAMQRQRAPVQENRLQPRATAADRDQGIGQSS